MRQRLVNLFWHLPVAIAANLIYGFPGRKLTIIGVTGTSGKTTVCHLLHHILVKAGIKAALLSTVSVPGLHVTNPKPFVLQRLLKQYLKQGYTHVVLEVTSHGLDQYRNWGIKFSFGLITNITHEHLDYHKTLANYRKVKLKLLQLAQVPVEFSQSDDFVRANINAATALAKAIGVNHRLIDQAVKSFPGVPGRMELVHKGKFKVYIDFAHKPDALDKALSKLKRETKGKLIAVFGCAGLRDRTKRPIMGEIAGRLADMVILTAEDPRTEDVKEIIDQIARGSAKPVRKVPDRQKAINLAIRLARPGDVVGCFGKSHEKSLCFGTIEYAWDEYAAVKKALNALNPRRRRGQKN